MMSWSWLGLMIWRSFFEHLEVAQVNVPKTRWPLTRLSSNAQWGSLTSNSILPKTVVNLGAQKFWVKVRRRWSEAILAWMWAKPSDAIGTQKPLIINHDYFYKKTTKWCVADSCLRFELQTGKWDCYYFR